MPSRDDWLQSNRLSRAKFRETGGCFWDVQPNSPGNSLRIPEGTEFKIPLEGSLSHRFIDGVCEGGEFVVVNDPHAGRYASANEAVNAARSHIEATNAYLYIEFKVGSVYISANELRYDPQLSSPRNRAEEEAIKFAKSWFRKRHAREARSLSDHDLTIRAEQLLDEEPKLLERGRAIAEAMAIEL